MFVGQSVGALEFHQQNVLNQNIGKILSDTVALMCHIPRSLPNRPNPRQLQLPKQSPFINLLPEPSPQSIGNLKNSPL